MKFAHLYKSEHRPAVCAPRGVLKPAASDATGRFRVHSGEHLRWAHRESPMFHPAHIREC